MNLFLKIIKETFVSGIKTCNIIFFFLIEALFFCVIAIITGIIISFPIFYFGTKFTEIYKTIVFLGIALVILTFFTYRFIKAFREKMQILSSSSQFSQIQKWFLSLIDSAPLLLPKWIKILCYIVFGLLVFYFILLIVGLFIFFFLVDFFEVHSPVVTQIYSFLSQVYKVFVTFIFENIWSFIFFIVELIILMTIFNGSAVLGKNQKLGLGIWYFVVANIQLTLLYTFFYVLVLYKMIALFYSAVL